MDDYCEELLGLLLNRLSKLHSVHSGDIPDIGLYMEQITMFMDSKLRCSTRHPESDKVLTKAMINNYTKNDLLPPPDGKRYGKEHVLLLTFIYYFKNILNMDDIDALLGPIEQEYYGDGREIEDIYNELFEMVRLRMSDMRAKLTDTVSAVQDSFLDQAGSKRQFLMTFAVICLLGTDVFVEKLLIEQLIDSLESE